MELHMGAHKARTFNRTKVEWNPKKLFLDMRNSWCQGRGYLILIISSGVFLWEILRLHQSFSGPEAAQAKH